MEKPCVPCVLSMAELLTEQLKQAQQEHHFAVLTQQATNEDWATWYAQYLAPRLVPIMVKLACQPAQHLTPDNTPLPVAQAHVKWVEDPDTHVHYPDVEPEYHKLHVG